MRRPTFREVVASGVALRRELAGCDSHFHNKLSRAAFRASALALGGLDEGGAAELARRLAGGSYLSTWPILAATVDAWRQPATWDPHALNLSLEARVELQGEGVKWRELIAAAGFLATQGEGGFFGTATVAGEGAYRAETGRVRLAELCAAAETLAQIADFTVTPAPSPTERAAGWVQMFVAGTPVTGGPGFGERLVAWLDTAGLDGLPEVATATVRAA